MCSRCDNEGNSLDYLEEEQSNNTNLQGSIEKEKEEVGTNLIVKREKINVFDLYAMGLYCGIKRKIEDLTLIGYHPRETYCFCKFYFEYNGELDGTDRPTKFLRFLFPQGALKILINLYVRKWNVYERIHTKMKEFVSETYMEPEKILLYMKREEIEEDEEEDFFGSDWCKILGVL